MIGDKINVRPEYYTTARAILSHLAPELSTLTRRYVVAIGGESGSGKSVLATCLAECFATDYATAAQVLQLDDYFTYPPATTHTRRLDDIGNVGVGEVRMDLLQSHVDTFRAGESSLVKPCSVYAENRFISETIDLTHTQILIIEGTYALLLGGIDITVYMERNYTDTYEQRRVRAREIPDSFTEKVLAIEHQLVVASASSARIRVCKDYTVVWAEEAG